MRAFRQAGWQTAFFYRQSREAAEALARETGAIAVPCDVADSEAVRRAVQETKAFLPHVDALINNAGIASQELLTDVTDEQWRRMVDTNLSGAFYLCRAVLPGMISRREGFIVNISSIWGRIGASCEVPYSAVKAGLIGLTRGLAKEVGPSGVRVNCVCPGVIRTDMLSTFTPDDLAELADNAHRIRGGDDDVEVELTGLDLGGEVVETDDIGAGGKSFFSLGALGEHGNANGLARAFRHHDSAADGLVGLARIDAELDGHVDRFVELGNSRFLDEFESFNSGVKLVGFDLGVESLHALAKLSHYRPSTMMPMERAEPAIVRTAASMSAAVRSGAFVLAISSA